MKSKNFKVVVLGCKVNTYEAESVRCSLINKGYQETKDVADIYVLFTCAVTNVAESKTRKKIRQIIRENNQAIICVVGCYVQIKSNLSQLFPEVAIFVGSKDKDKIVNLIEEYELTKIKQFQVSELTNSLKFDNLPIQQFISSNRAFLKIQDGCNQFCSYCIIPYARGRERSMDFDEVLKQAKSLSQNNPEIVLTGIHTGRYRANGKNLADVIKKLLQLPDLKRIRISSIEITEVTDEIISLMATNLKIARHLHIPLQSGNNHQLQDMNRPYTTEEFFSRINYIKQQIPNISISTDLIVGYPGETEADFLKTYDFVKQCSFSFLHIFPYAKKNQTKAALSQHQVTEFIKKQRVKKMLALSKMLYNNYKRQFINQKLEVLIEQTKNNQSFGHCSEYIPIYISQAFSKNSFVSVRVIDLIDDKLQAIKWEEY